MPAIVDSSNWLQRAPMAPRGWVISSPKSSAVSAETLPLEVLVRRELANSSGPTALVLSAGPGFGKTTALRHLASSLQDLADVTWLDEPSYGYIDAVRSEARIVFTAGPQLSPAEPVTTLAIAPWRDDDVIEYLLARHRDRIGSIMPRVQRDEQREELAGSPMLWTIVLDAMAADESLPDCAAALCAHMDQLLDTDAALDAAGREALLRLCGSKELMPTPAAGGKIAHLMHQPYVRTLLAAERITWNLARAVDADDLIFSLPLELIDVVAKRVANRPATIKRLQTIVVGSDDTQHAMAASILIRAQPGWREIGRSPCFQNASLRGAKWEHLSLRRINLCNADLSEADLIEANLEESDAAHALFDRAILRAANLVDVKASGSYFAGADLRKARLDRAELAGSVFDRANLTFACLRRAVFTGCSFRGALLIGANLSGANLTDAIIEDADFREADLSLASLNHLPLCKARSCVRAIFRRAELRHADLSGLQLPEADFVKADLDHADLTGSQMSAADFHGAKLTNAGLADIDWPNADLRRVDFTGASFHLGSSRSGLVGSTIPCEGSRTGFYPDEFKERDFKNPEEIRKANLCGANLTGASVEGTDWYLVDLRGAGYSNSQRQHFERCGAILT